MSRSPLILGCDAGFAGLGAALLDPRTGAVVWAGTHRTKPDAKKRQLRQVSDDQRRLHGLVDWLDGVLAEHRPQLAAVELPHGGAKGQRAHRCMGMATALVLTVLRLRGIGCVEVLPEDVKLAACGCLGASKAAVMAAARERWAYDWPTVKADLEHQADAAFAALHVLEQGGPIVQLLTHGSLAAQARARRQG